MGREVHGALEEAGVGDGGGSRRGRRSSGVHGGSGQHVGRLGPTENHQESGLGTLTPAVARLEGCGPAAHEQALLWAGRRQW